MALDGFLDLVARDRADNLLGDLSALEDQQGRDAADVELARGVGVFVHVEFHDLYFSRHRRWRFRPQWAPASGMACTTPPRNRPSRAGSCSRQ